MGRLKLSLFGAFVALAVLAVAALPAVAAQPDMSVKTVTVKKGDTLYHLCMKHYGTFNAEILLLIRQYNPSLKSAGTIIRPGDTLKLPFAKSDTALKAQEGKAAVPSQRPGKGTAGDSRRRRPRKEAPVALVSPGPDPAVSAGRAESGKPKKYDPYPALMDAEISRLEWLTDNTALVTGKVRLPREVDVTIKLYVSVPGDLDYEQPLRIKSDGSFEALVSIGRPHQDYDKEFVVKLVQFVDGRGVSEISQAIVKKEETPRIITFEKKGKYTSLAGAKGFETWIDVQMMKAEKVDNKDFQVKDGLVVKNYRYMDYSPDERYLSRYGRVTLYGSATIAKALVLRGDSDRARRILNVWIAQMDAKGGIPRSANILGDNYISPDVRSGDMAHFLGALALVKAITGTLEYDDAILKISKNYFLDLQDKKTGLVRGGYSRNSDGYSKGGAVEAVPWASAEHNFDIFQSLLLLGKVFQGEQGSFFREFSRRVGEGLDRYMWDPEVGTFNRGYRFEAGPDKARALDCSSWGVLYLMKQARLAGEEKNPGKEDFYVRRGVSAITFLEKNFVAQWCYEAPDSSRDCIKGYKPYAGKIDDVQIESTSQIVDWDTMNSLVWSEGTLGVAMAYYEMCRVTKNLRYCASFDKVVAEILKLQALSDKGGLLYSSERVEGHFTRGEELASLAWLGYALTVKERRLNPTLARYQDWIPW
jgi:phage tail protein X